MVIEALPVAERSVLAEVLPELVGEGFDAKSEEVATPGRTVPVVSFPPGTGKDPEKVLGVEPLAEESPGRYFLLANSDDMAPRIEEGDRLLVAPRQVPSSGSLVVVRRRKQVSIRQVAATGDPLLLVAANPRVAPEKARPRDIQGVVIEIRRPLA